ncbi:hypothetical protein GTO89_08800 [Heliobacterium gestii]|uniref:Uncharacterized protein n=1 Tax=Heliomicrobium gestii TaxID=2699 RepID=A0A845LI56_HELGE|nr:hypothetical protein [Heliomicrobium gestii]MBM7866587.1 hypothetical protein [Heliomicrobium gestii]MZP43133.1 hypothetical protein [Heliomicrobium gestii]
MVNRKVVIGAFVLFLLTLTFASSAFAATNNSVSDLPVVDADKNEQKLGVLSLQEDPDFPEDLQSNGTVTIEFPPGVTIDDTSVSVEKMVYWQVYPDEFDVITHFGGQVRKIDDSVLQITLPNTSRQNREAITITPYVKVGTILGDNIEVRIDGSDAGITNGTYELAKVSSPTDPNKPIILFNLSDPDLSIDGTMATISTNVFPLSSKGIDRPATIAFLLLDGNEPIQMAALTGDLVNKRLQASFQLTKNQNYSFKCVVWEDVKHRRPLSSEKTVSISPTMP